MVYATPEQLEAMRVNLKRDKKPCTVMTDVAGLTALLVCVLDTMSATDMGGKDKTALLELARYLADMLEDRRPDVEPYIAMLFGVASLRNGGLG